MNNLKTLREHLKMSKRQFAMSIGVNEGNYNKMEAGSLSISAGIIERIKSTYPDVSLDWLLYGTGDQVLKYKFTCNECKQKDELLAEKDARIQDKEEIISGLKAQIELLKTQLEEDRGRKFQKGEGVKLKEHK